MGGLRGWVLAVGLVLAGGLALAGVSAPAQARPFDEVVEAGVVRIVVYRDFAPFSSGPDDAMEGVDVDLAREIAKGLGVDLHLMPLTADENLDDDLRNAIWLGPRVSREVGDIMLHVPYDQRIKQSNSLIDTRNEMIVLFSPYYREQMVIARHAATPRLDALHDEDRLGVEVDSMADFVLSGALGGRYRDQTRRFIALPMAVEDLRSGALDGVMGPRSEVEWILRDVPGEWKVSAPMVPMMGHMDWPLGIAVREDSRDLGYAVDGIFRAMMTDGRMAGLFRAHGLTYTEPYP